ncbi:hypothetical protein IVN40_04385 [Chryseobacterium indologenes]|uniref:hypothetical protein n=1 Tax=Chryseobacterium indologenes TaxID=253 RepID=UPI0018943278|nr:hypothetical protein [Chryseobacterium indologenes]MBF6643422.1 hypothetical protein [Chryseobacterium indologenes]
MNQNNLYKTQIDFISLKLNSQEVSNLNWAHLKEHPTLHNQYTLREKIRPDSKNFSLYLKKSQEIIINLSIPYFLYGHNYHTVGYEELLDFSVIIKELLGINLLESQILELEYGGFCDTEIASKEFIKKIQRMNDYELIYSKSYMKMFEHKKQGICFKIYDAVENSKNKRTYSKELFLKKDILKFELKLKKSEKFLNRKLWFKDLIGEPDQNSVLNQFKNTLTELRNKLILPNKMNVEPVKYDLVHIIFVGLKNIVNHHTESISVAQELRNIIDNSPLSPSQKSKRRKAVQNLENQYNQNL